MKRLPASLLAIGLAATSGLASAQSYGSYGSNGRYDDPAYRNPNQAQPANGGYYDYARVVRVDPVMGSGYNNTSSRRCYSESERGYAQGGYDQYGNDGYYDQSGNYHRNGSGNGGYYDQYGNYRQNAGSNTGRTVATVIGGIAGAVLGSKVGGGSGTYAATAIGSMVGGMAGRQIYDQTQRNRNVRTGVVTVCDPEPAYGNGYGSYRSNDSRASAYDVTYEYNGRRYTRRMDYHPGDRVRVRVDVSPQ